MSELYKRIETLCNTIGTNITEMCRASGASRGSLTDLKMGRTETLTTKTLSKIASYFGVSVGYLLGTETEKVPAPEDEHSITFDDFTYAMHNETKNLSQEKKDMLLQMARFFNEELEKEERNKK